MAKDSPATWLVGSGRSVTLDRPRLMGIVNATPDSFSDGGQFLRRDDAVAHGLQLIGEGADLIDVGGESTRPGATRVSVEEQISRTAPVIESIRAWSDVIISIDTTRAAVARAALDAGADVINDVSAGVEDPEIIELAASRACGLILMHRLVPPDADRYSDRYEQPPVYDDVTQVVVSFLADRIAAAERAGVQRERIVIDPGLGFGKTVRQNLTLVRETARLLDLDMPLLAAASRKSFLGAMSGTREPEHRLAESLAMACMQFQAGIRLFRVHDVGATRQALAVVAEITGGAICSESG